MKQVQAMGWVVCAMLVGGGCSHKSDGQSPDAGAAPGDASVGIGPAMCQPIPPASALPPATTPVAGTRLVPRTIAEPVTGGVEVPWVVHDTQLDIDCQPGRFSDGTIRCLPAVGQLLQLGPLMQFADAAMTIPVDVEPLAAAPAAGTLAEAIMLSSSPGDASDAALACLRSSVTLWRTGARRDGTQTFSLDGTTTVSASFGIFDLQPVPVDFVQLQELRTQLSGSIATRELHGADGSRIFSAGLYDSAHASQVAFAMIGTGSDATARLVPPWGRLSLDRHFTPSPTTPQGHDAWCSTSDPIFRVSDGDGCDVSSSHFLTGTVDPSSPGSGLAVYEVVDSSLPTYGCNGEFGPDEPAFMDACAVSPLSDWTLASTVHIGGGRLTTAAWQIGDATVAPPAWSVVAGGGTNGTSRVFRDTSLDVDCEPKLAADGALRCLPVTTRVAYSDAACSSPIVITLDQATPAYAALGSQPGTPLFNGIAGADDVEGQVTIFGVGAARPAAMVYQRVRQFTTLGNCEGTGSMASFAVGAEIPASSFVALELHDVH